MTIPPDDEQAFRLIDRISRIESQIVTRRRSFPGNIGTDSALESMAEDLYRARHELDSMLGITGITLERGDE